MSGPDAVLVMAVVVLIVVVLFVAWRLWPRGGIRRGRGRGSGLQPMSRDDSIGYFRDFNQRGAGVREEDRSGRWGAGDGG
jgi:hypothetical protein